VVKSSIDERVYKAITLKNNMRVLLISDPDTLRSAAALDVHVGSFSDPEAVPGLAHFCGTAL
jgi:insulysin